AVMAFTLLRRPSRAISLRLGDWLLAIAATGAPLMVQPVAQVVLPGWVGPVAIVFWLLGNLLQAGAKLSLRRSFGVAPANRGVKTQGLYRFVRHPMYAGYLWVHLGQLLMFPSLFNLAIYAIAWWAQILRMMAEEALLGQDPAYRAFAGQVRFRLVPGLY
ncbi:MAG TPA: isoprenylcysteine carboxylmethyltransferase family protein, partial [Novosphingobium sp.]|nr:isoprenylcysteine carboxylmethyltransferase family protein [Novosphingobium sp.]